MLNLRFRSAWLVLSLLVASCAGIDPGGRPGPLAEAPMPRVGDRWVYRVQDGFRSPVVWQETHEVREVGPQGVTVKVAVRGDVYNGERTEQWTAPGIVRSGAVFENESRQFQPPLLRYRFPMNAGDTWSQRIVDPANPPGPYGPLTRYVRVGGYDTVVTPAGTFDAIRLRVFMRLDDETFWRQATECNYLVWYAPALGISVREERDAEYREKGSGRDGVFATFRSQHAVVELVSFARGPG